MSVLSPKQLVDEFKKSGEFDRLRRELFIQFQRSDRVTAFKSRVDDIARQRLASDQKLTRMPYDAIYRELMGEIDRYPIVERAIAEVPLLSDASFVAAIRTSLQRILDENQGRSTGSGSAEPTNVNSDGSCNDMPSPSRDAARLPNGDVAGSNPS